MRKITRYIIEEVKYFDSSYDGPDGPQSIAPVAETDSEANVKVILRGFKSSYEKTCKVKIENKLKEK